MEQTEPKLAPPGAGISLLQKLVGQYVLLPLYCRKITWEQVPEKLEQQGESLLRMAEGRSEQELIGRVLVPPQIGLEDSSRYHSYAMVLEHLTIVGNATAEIVFELTHHRRPEGQVKIVDLKPKGGRPAADAMENYRSMLDRFRSRTVDEAGDRKSRLAHPHPWFGSLVALRWLCFAPFHQEIHIKQARLILDRSAR